jgi:carnitine O-palmitoyltransferase 1
MGRGWKLSTSQVPVAVAADEWKTVKDRDELYVFPCGGFGPVADDGYGVCYTFSGENHIFFHVSSKKSCPTTSSTKMQEEIFKAMRDLADVLNPPEQ